VIRPAGRRQWERPAGKGLLDPLDENLPREVVRYGEFILLVGGGVASGLGGGCSC
jgi:hypothetical protein